MHIIYQFGDICFLVGAGIGFPAPKGSIREFQFPNEQGEIVELTVDEANFVRVGAEFNSALGGEGGGKLHPYALNLYNLL